MSFQRILLVGVIALVALSRGSPARAQQEQDPLAKAVGLAPDGKSVPIWTQPSQDSRQGIAAVARAKQGSVMLVGSAKYGFGTAWVLSKKERLLATNAHVADILAESGGTMSGFRSGTAEVFTIDRAWYHPGVQRYVNNGFSVRSEKPSTGFVNPLSPDVAVLHVAAGLEMPDEWTMATADEVAQCFAAPVGMMGFPAHDNGQFPSADLKAVATFREGVISRMTDFYNDPGRPFGELQYLQHSMTSWFGFSGSPLFLPNGHVVALNNSGRPVKQGESQIQLSFGIRIDCLWELLVLQGLDAQVPVPKPKAELLLERYNHPDPMAEKFAQAQQLVRAGTLAITAEDFTTAGEKLNEAIKLAPNYGFAYSERGRMYNIYTNRYGEATGVVKGEKQQRYAELGLADYRMAAQLIPSDTKCYINSAAQIMAVNIAKTGSATDASVEAILTKLIDGGLSDRDRSTALRFRSEATGYAKRSLPDMNEAVRLLPFSAEPYQHRAQYWKNKDKSLVEADLRRAKELRAAEVARLKAWKLLNAKETADRDAPEALRLATEACEATSYKYYAPLLSLAAAQARTGHVDLALENAKKAALLAPTDDSRALCQSWVQRFEKKPDPVK